jgi:hypothetical protein
VRQTGMRTTAINEMCIAQLIDSPKPLKGLRAEQGDSQWVISNVTVNLIAMSDCFQRVTSPGGDHKKYTLI